MSKRGNEMMKSPTARALRQMCLLGIIFVISGCAENFNRPESQLVASTERKSNPMTHFTVPPGKSIAVVASGCFWCTEAIFSDVKGVDSVVSGYSGGQVENPTYEQVCSGTTGHAEAVAITYDPKVVSYHDLLAMFFATHDPTTLNRQGADAGTQYRSAVFYQTPEEEEIVKATINELTDQKIFPNPIVTEISAFTNFYSAEDYHKDYYAKHGFQPYCQAVIAPKVAKFRQHYRDKLKK